MPRISFDSSPQISSGLCLLFVLVLSMTVGWLTVLASDDIVENVQNSSLVKIDKRGVPAKDVNASH